MTGTIEKIQAECIRIDDVRARTTPPPEPVIPPGWVKVGECKAEDWISHSRRNSGCRAISVSDNREFVVISRISKPGGVLEKDWEGMEGWEVDGDYRKEPNGAEGWIATDGNCVSGTNAMYGYPNANWQPRWYLRRKPAAMPAPAAPTPSPEKISDALRQGYEYTGEYREWEADEIIDNYCGPLRAKNNCDPSVPKYTTTTGKAFILRKLPVLEPVPAGYRVVGFRLPKKGEAYWSTWTEKFEVAHRDWTDDYAKCHDKFAWWNSRRHILERIPEPSEKTPGEEIAVFSFGECESITSKRIANHIDTAVAKARAEGRD